MLKEALQYLAGLAQESARPTKVDINDPSAVRYLTGSGAVVTVEVPAPPRQHEVCQLADLIALAARFDGSVVWYDEGGVVAVFDDDGHRAGRATMGLVESDLFAAVRHLAALKPAYDHKGFVRLLKITLAGTLPPSFLLDVVRRVKFDNGTVTHSESRKSRESLGREITATVSAEGEIPDAVTLLMPVYKTLGETHPYPVRCTVEVDPLEGSFRLLPFPDEVERVQQLAIGSIAERLGEQLPDGTPCYYGRP